MGELAYEMNVEAASCARRRAKYSSAGQAALRRRRAGPDAKDRLDLAGRERPGARNITFDQLVDAYYSRPRA
jgi:5-methyltetrahydrofolate--homocysteine methyltransferase